MGRFKEIASLVSLIHYNTPKIKDNWRVELGEMYIGNVHDCDGIGGDIGNFTETGLFDYVCTLAKEDLEYREAARIRELHSLNEGDYEKPDEYAPDREPDLFYKGVDGYESEYWFKEMIMYCHVIGRLIPIRYDDEGDLVDFFDFSQGLWIDLGEIVLKGYKEYMSSQVDKELLKSDKDVIMEVIDMLERMTQDDQHSTELSDITNRLCKYHSGLE